MRLSLLVDLRLVAIRLQERWNWMFITDHEADAQDTGGELRTNSHGATCMFDTRVNCMELRQETMSLCKYVVKADLAHAALRVLLLACLGVDAGLGMLLAVDATSVAMSLRATHSEKVTTHLLDVLLMCLFGRFALRFGAGHDVVTREEAIEDDGEWIRRRSGGGVVR